MEKNIALCIVQSAQEWQDAFDIGVEIQRLAVERCRQEELSSLPRYDGPTQEEDWFCDGFHEDEVVKIKDIEKLSKKAESGLELVKKHLSEIGGMIADTKERTVKLESSLRGYLEKRKSSIIFQDEDGEIFQSSKQQKLTKAKSN